MKWSKNDDVLHIDLNSNPCNEIGLDMLNFFEKFLQEAPLSSSRALIISSSNEKGFSAGADLRALYEGMLATPDENERREKITDFVHRIHKVFDTIDMLPIPTIVVTHGICFGGGFELALLGDIIIAEDTTRFCFPELRLGLVPGFGGIPRLMREVPNQKIRDLLFTGRSMQAKSLPQLVSQVVPAGKGMNIARKTAQQMTKFHPEVTKQAKNFIKPNLREKLEQEKKLFLEMIMQPHVIEALQKFTQDESSQPYLP